MQALIGVLERRRARACRCLLIFEDAHWSDASSRELIAMPVRRASADLRIC